MNEGELDGREALCGQLWYMHCRMDRQASRNCKAGRSLSRHVPIWPVWHVTILHGGSSSYRLRPAVTVNSMLFFPLWLFLYCRCWVPSRVNSGGWWMTKVPFPRVCLKSLTLTLQRLTPMRCCHMWTRKLQSYALTISPHSSKITLAILPIFKCVPSLHPSFSLLQNSFATEEESCHPAGNLFLFRSGWHHISEMWSDGLAVMIITNIYVKCI